MINTRSTRLILGILVLVTLGLAVVAFRPAPAMAACTKYPIGYDGFWCKNWCSCASICSGTERSFRTRGYPGDFEYEWTSWRYFGDYTCDPGCPMFCN